MLFPSFFVLNKYKYGGKIIDKATYKYPALYPEGIEYVIVNGVIQVERSRFMKLPIGKIISRNK